MAKIDDKVVRHVAELARISLSDSEVKRYVKELAAIVNYIEQLQQLDTTQIEPLIQVNGLANVFREDEVTNTENRTALLANAPKKKDGFLTVRKVK